MPTLDELLQQSAPTKQPARSLDDLLQQSGPDISTISSEPIPPEELERERIQQFREEGLRSGEIVADEPGFFESIKADLPQMGGGLTGALAFERAARPLTSKIQHPLLQGAARLAAGVGGAFIGGMAGIGAEQTFRMNRPGAKSMTLKELYTEQLIGGVEEAGSELAGRGLAKGIGVGARAIGRKIVAPGAKAAAQLLRKSGLGITLAQATDNRLFDLMESIAEGSLVGGGGLQKLKTLLIPKAIKKATGDLSDSFARAVGRSMSPEEVGDIVFDTLNKKNTAFRRASKAIYKQVDNLVKRSGQTGDIVDVAPLKKFAEGKLSSKVNVLRSTTGDTLLESIIAMPDRITFKQASGLRSALLTQARTMSVTKDVALGATKQLSKLADGAIEKSGKQLSGDAFDMWRFANKFHREGKEVFNSKLIKSLGKTLADNPEKAVQRVFQKGASKQIRLLKDTVDEPTWNTLKHGYIESVLGRAKDADGVLRGKSFLNALDDDILKAAFNPSEVTQIKELGKAVELLQRPAAAFGATGKLVVAIGQASALGDIVSGRGFLTRPGQATILFTPVGFARIATSKKWSKLLIEGMKDPIKSAGILARLARVGGQFELENQVQQRQRRQEQFESGAPSLEQTRGFGGRGV